MTISNGVSAVALVSLAAGGLLGYEIGSRRLSAVQGALDSLHRTLAAQERQYEGARRQLVDSSGAIATEHQRDQDRLKADYELKTRRLEASNQDAERRIALLASRMGALDRERMSILGNPGPAGSASAAQRLAALDAERAEAATEKAGLACLGVRVPSEQVASLRKD